MKPTDRTVEEGRVLEERRRGTVALTVVFLGLSTAFAGLSLAATGRGTAAAAAAVAGLAIAAAGAVALPRPLRGPRGGKEPAAGERPVEAAPADPPDA